jgi:hypothetical protein
MDEYIKQVQDLFKSYVPKDEKIQISYGIEWKVNALSGDWMKMQGAEYNDLDVVLNMKKTMANDHIDVRIIKYTKEVKKEILDA